MPASDPLPAALRLSLRHEHGVRRLRPGQQQVIERVLAGRDTLAIMASGAGKSLCYQAPAPFLRGLTVVVSPLIALIKDQAERLERLGIVAEQLDSARTPREQRDSLARMAQERSDVIFVTPERLADAAFLHLLARHRVALVVVDEAHCIDQWGHDFRPAYLQIGAALRALGEPTVLALTATATPQVVDEIRRHLARPAMPVVDTGLYRANLRLQVVQCVREEEKFDRLREALQRARGAGIVYCATVKACEALQKQLQAEGESVTWYHGRLPAAQRHAHQDRFMKGQARVMVATTAFGMGVDKADLRFIVHWQLPGSPEAYYQEAGRAGRDGEPADCALLYWRHDRQVQQFFLACKHASGDDLRQVVAALRHASGGAPLAALHAALPQLSRPRVEVALALLREAGVAAADRSRVWRLRGSGVVDTHTLRRLAAEYVDKAERDREALERMVFYAQTGFCRWRVLLEYFDEPLPFAGERCGHCDNCLRPAPTPRVAPAWPHAAAPAFARGADVEVPRYGSGRVTAATADEVSVVFPDGQTRTFVAAYVRPHEAGG